MNSLLRFIGLFIMLSMPLLACYSASLVSKPSDEDILRGLQQLPRYLMFYHRAAPNFKRASSALDTLTGVTLGKRSINPSFNRFENPATSDIVTDIYNSQQKSHPLRFSKLYNDNYPNYVDLAIPIDYNMFPADQ